MLHCLEEDSPETTALQRQRAPLKWHQQDTFFNGGGGGAASFLMGLGEVVDAPQYWGEFGCNSGFEMNMNGAVSRTASCPPAVAAAVAMEANGGVDSAALPERKVSSLSGRESFKRRKPDTALSKQDDEETKDKKIKVCNNEGMESKITQQSSNNNVVGSSKTKNKKLEAASASSSKDNSKASDVQKPDFIHVRARRGQATDSHSLAERVRREKISERMKFLQDLVPGCNKITGKAGMLDEIINYVQSLQRQVEFLSLKLATVNPRLDFDIDNLFAKDTIRNGSICFPTIDMPLPDMSNPSSYLQFNPLQQPMSCSGLDMGMNLDMVGLRRTTSDPVPIPETFIDSTCYPPPSVWDCDLLSLYNMDFHQDRPTTSFSSQHQFEGPVEDNTNLKMEM